MLQSKLIIGILTSHLEQLPHVLHQLTERFGAPDYIGAWRRFDHSQYYRDEMGEGLHRCFVSFAQLVEPYEAERLKKTCVEIETIFSQEGQRTINIDPGYLDANKLVLISGKYGGNKLCVGPDLYADFLLWYSKGWQAMPWAFPDLRDGGFFRDFMEMRKRYKRQGRGQAADNSSG